MKGDVNSGTIATFPIVALCVRSISPVRENPFLKLLACSRLMFFQPMKSIFPSIMSDAIMKGMPLST